MKTDFGGLPIAFHLTGGEASDNRNFETLLDIGPDINPRAALGDKGYDSKSNREAARQRGICPAIPYRSNTKDIPVFFPKALYKTRARIEQAVGKLKRFKRIALRCEKTAQNYGSFVALALGFILIKSVHTAYWPEIYVHSLEGRTLDQKRSLVKDITDAVVGNFSVPADAVMIQIIESSKADKAKGGVLFSSR